MTIDTTLNQATDDTRQSLLSAYATALANDDRAEMQRLEGLVAELDAVRRRLALGALADAVAAVGAIRTAMTTPPDAKPKSASADMAKHKGLPAGADQPKDQDLAGDPFDGTPASDTEEDTGAEETAQMAWGALTRRKHGDAFNEKVRAIAGRLGCDPNFLMAAMAFETAETFSPGIRNGAGSGATGLIQFMPSTAKRLGTTTAALAKMDAVDQLDLVERYFQTATRKRLRTLSDIYMAILWPVAVGKAESHVLFRKPSRAYAQNHGFDVNKDGLITKAEAAAKVQQKLVKGMKADRIG